MPPVFSSAYIQTCSSGGNMFSKTGVGNYAYNSGSHRLSNVDNTDDVIPYSSQSITYNAWGKVAEVNETIGSDTYKYELTYGPDLQRVLAVLWKNNSLVHLVTYGDGYEEKYQNGHITYYYYVDGADGNSAVYTSHTQTGDKVYCIDRDHLGSVTALFDQNGNKCFSASFDPWGRRYVEQGSIEYDRGYTGHEHIDELGLIDMNGRMYDPILGRFISVDPYIQAPSNPQNFNRYAYCLNNPVRYTDPSGETIEISVFTCIYEFVVTLFDGGLNVFNKEKMTNAWNRYGQRVENSWKITLSTFKTDSNLDFWDNCWLIISRSLPFNEAAQSHTGEAGAQLLNLLGHVKSVDYYGGATLVETDYKSRTAGLTYGNVIIAHDGTKASPNDETFQHEYGHVLQSRKYGWTYLFNGLTSGFSALIDKSNRSSKHLTRGVEIDANRLAFRYFSENVSGFSHDISDQFGSGVWGSSKWAWENNPIDKEKNHYYKLYH